jgi:hypothetical protein
LLTEATKPVKLNAPIKAADFKTFLKCLFGMFVIVFIIVIFDSKLKWSFGKKMVSASDKRFMTEV